MSQIHIPVSIGELIDKITILQIKSERIQGASKIANVRFELAALMAVWQQSGLDQALIQADWDALKAINAGLWEIEDGKRSKEAQGVFDAEFVALARQVYLQNDQRAALKRQINEKLGSRIVEEKSYGAYTRSPA
jgi:hypothetical protein